MEPLEHENETPENVENEGMEEFIFNALTGDGKDAETEEEEQSNWRLNSSVLYRTLMNHSLTWPSLTCHWSYASNGMSHLLVGTHVSEDELSSLTVLRVVFPQKDDQILNLYQEHENYSGFGFGDADHPKLTVSKTISISNSINRARWRQPEIQHAIIDEDEVETQLKLGLIAANLDSGDTIILDSADYGEGGLLDSKISSSTKLVLTGHDEECYGLCWNGAYTNEIATCGQDGKALIYDIGNPQNSTLQPVILKKCQTGLNDILWDSHTYNCLLAVGDSGEIFFYDTRTAETLVQKGKPSKDALNSIVQVPNKSNIFVVGSDKGNIYLIDKRQPHLIQHTLEVHTKGVGKLSYSNKEPFHLASASDDGAVALWDLERVGKEATTVDEDPEELLMLHKGHFSSVWDVDFHPFFEHALCSTSDNNELHIWQPKDEIFCDDETEDLELDEEYEEDTE